MITILLAGLIPILGLSILGYKLDCLANDVKDLKKTVFELENKSILTKRDINTLEKDLHDWEEEVIKKLNK